jgi:endonuclease/exonuclease/phosphatase family metal-dependent hydrolase
LPQLGGGFAVGALWLLGRILAQVFTTVYDYIPVIGPWFRDRFWLVFLGVGLGCALPVLLALRSRDDSLAAMEAEERPAPGSVLSGLSWVGLCVLTLIAAWGLSPRPPAQPEGDGTLRVLTYNIQQGYSADGVKDFAGQLAVLQEVDADLIGLQESDTNRIAGGNADIVGYFARELKMYSYYGPSTVPGTFGITLLSRYPIEAAETFYMYSLGEQTATIAARVRVGERRFNVYVTHLGNGGPLVQQTAILERVQGQSDVILMGDFNFRPDSEQYRLTTAAFADAWMTQTETPVSDPAFDPQRRIDHIFVSPGTRVVQAQYLVSRHSDHPTLWADITW